MYSSAQLKCGTKQQSLTVELLTFEIRMKQTKHFFFSFKQVSSSTERFGLGFQLRAEIFFY